MLQRKTKSEQLVKYDFVSEVLFGSFLTQKFPNDGLTLTTVRHKRNNDLHLLYGMQQRHPKYVARGKKTVFSRRSFTTFYSTFSHSAHRKKSAAIINK